MLGSTVCFGGAVWWFPPAVAWLAFLLVSTQLVQLLVEGRMPLLSPASCLRSASKVHGEGSVVAGASSAHSPRRKVESVLEVGLLASPTRVARTERKPRNSRCRPS